MHVRSIVGTVLFCAAILSLAAPTSLQAAECRHATPTKLPDYAVSGAWAGSTLLVVDSRRNAVLRYSEEGDALGPLGGWLGDELGRFRPSGIAARDDGRIVLELYPGRLLNLDQNLRRSGLPDDVLAGAHRDSVSVEAMFQQGYAGSDVVSCSDWVSKEGAAEVWHSGFLRIPPQRDQFQVLYSMRPQDTERLFCRLGFPYVAAIGDTAYFLVMEATPRLFKHAPGDAEATPIRVELAGQRPSMPILPREEEFKGLMQQVEASTLPVGLYAWNDRLYVLSRQPAKGGTEWSLSEIDPASEAVVATARIETSAPHLTVIPGPRFWAVLEKAEPVKLGDQPVKSLLLIPAAEITGLADGKICSD